jgi:hypothetical protein
MSNLIELTNIREDMGLIASWIFQKSPKTQKYYRRVVVDFFKFYPNLNLKNSERNSRSCIHKVAKNFRLDEKYI